MNSYYIGVDIGGTFVRVVIANDARMLVKFIAPTVKQGPDTTLVSEVIFLIHKGLDHLSISMENIQAIGTSSAGPFVDGEKIFCPNISGQGNTWTAVPYLASLRTHFFHTSTFELANDCVSSVKAEHEFGAGRGFQNCVYITISTGVGGGIICDSQLLQGKGKNAGHVGHMILQKDGARCGCGQHGCVESILSGPSIARRAKEHGLTYHGSSNFTAKEVFELYYQHDPKAVAIIQETIEYMGIFFSNVIDVTDTECIILGGSVFRHNHAVLLPAVQKYLDSHSYKVIAQKVQFKLAELGEYVGDLAGLSLILPPSIIAKWEKTRPWITAEIPQIQITLEEIRRGNVS